ncbi:uncharacterized protein LOC115387699 isoform X2 [Salarias fasciatus]|uniref:uncharacterized protein LOC115387699 isoform X2 n=1 Tax=Salarias fasciatus TaxID=181472 RepID=UPI0011767964|nr:uncharacterized protein LOC115387699 isoform X2 [Salarias fasciatus]
MRNQILLKITAITLLNFGKPSYSCIARNYSCKNIKTAEGFEYRYECPEESEVHVSSHGTSLVSALRDHLDPDLSEEVIKFSRTSLFSRDCLDIKVECVFTSEGHEEDKCVDIKVSQETTEETTERPTVTTEGKKNAPNKTYIYWIASGIATIVIVVAMIAGRFFCWKRGLRNGRCGSGGNNAEQALSLQRVPDQRDNTTAQTMNTTSSHRAVNGRANNGRTAGDAEAEDHESERRSLLCADGATIQTSDMTGEAGASMNESGFHSEPQSSCSTEPEFDVESTNNSEDLQEIKVYQ